jgi:hypothetical protein
LHNFIIRRWRVMVAHRMLAGRGYDTYVLRWRDTRVEITETIDGNYEFKVNGRHQTGVNGKRLDAFEVDVLLAVWCAQDMSETQDFSLERLRDGVATHEHAQNHPQNQDADLRPVVAPIEPLRASLAVEARASLSEACDMLDNHGFERNVG